MSLATRCPACGTVFRVVLDQLRISEGWVRCGRCNAVFDAAEVLFDIDLGTPVQLDLAAPAAGRPVAHALPDTQTDTATHTDAATLPPAAPGAGPPSPPDEPLLITDWSDSAGAPLAQVDPLASSPVPHTAAWADPGQRIDPSFDAAPDGALAPAPQTAHLLRNPSVDTDDDIHFSNGVLARAPARPSIPAPGWTPAPTPAAQAQAASGDGPVLAPSFLRAADRAARWRRPAVRTGLAVGVGLLAVTAALQAALLDRDNLAAQWPGSAPLLRSLCRLAACQVQPPRRIDAITVDNSALGRLDGTGQYRLQLVLHNRADVALLAPALELALTDSQGKLVMRRVLRLADLGWPGEALPARQSITLQALLAAGEQRIDGYSVELFYP